MSLSLLSATWEQRAFSVESGQFRCQAKAKKTFATRMSQRFWWFLSNTPGMVSEYPKGPGSRMIRCLQFGLVKWLDCQGTLALHWTAPHETEPPELKTKVICCHIQTCPLSLSSFSLFFHFPFSPLQRLSVTTTQEFHKSIPSLLSTASTHTNTSETLEFLGGFSSFLILHFPLCNKNCNWLNPETGLRGRQVEPFPSPGSVSCYLGGLG